jgi:hypothetical protein
VINTEAEDVHIDILQVHDNATADSDSMSYKDDTTIKIASDLTPDLLQSELQASPQNLPSTTVTSTPPISDNPRDPHDLLWWRESINLDKANLTLMGFSKGCVVLNQVSAAQSNSFSLFLKRLTPFSFILFSLFMNFIT